jgi:hypothetical protein
VAKVFTAADVVVAIGPALYGRPVQDLNRVVQRVLAVPDCVPLLGVKGARERTYATAAALATEAAVAELVARGTGTTRAATVPTDLVKTAIARAEQLLGRPLTSGQAKAVRGICGEGRHISLVLGVAGAGKTTAIRCAAEAFTAAGYEVVGTATSGQAARTLGREAGLAQSRTMASLLWRLDHHTLELTPRHVVVLDEAGMTDDQDMLRLLTVCDLAKAKVILVGDHRQLGPVGPGGALRALLNRHYGIVHVLAENVRQDEPNEREALRQLRGGKVAQAVAWYAENDRIRIAPDTHDAQRATVDAWYDDVCAGRDAAMYAWRRTNVDALNRLARDRYAINGRLTGPDLAAPGGRHYSVGDQIVTLAPAADGQVVTSERGEVVSVDVHRRVLIVRMDHGRIERLAGDELAADRLAHGYAVTVHRAQASTVDVAHRFEDGGGRELGYVSMSRGRERNTVQSWPTASTRPSKISHGTGPSNAEPAGPSTPAPPPPTPSPWSTTAALPPVCEPPSTMPVSKPNSEPSPPPSHPTEALNSPTSTESSAICDATAPSSRPAGAATPKPQKATPLSASSRPADSLKRLSTTPRRPTAGETAATGAKKPPTGPTRKPPPKRLTSRRSVPR